MRRLRILHAIHDFVPRHRAGSEIYAHDLATEQTRRHDVWVLAAEYDPSAPHATLRWRREGTLPIIELVNNWAFPRFDDTYSSGRLNELFGQVLEIVQPDVLHVHNLLNLSLDLPRLARERGAAVVATLHDYTLMCISGGQRIHRAERHICRDIDPARCARCFGESPFATQLAAGRLAASVRMPRLLRMASAVGRRMPGVAAAARTSFASPITDADVRRRLAYARHVVDMIDVSVAPSASVADDYVRFGAARERVEVCRLGHPIGGQPRIDGTARGERPLRIGYVGSLSWHKGVHVLIEAASHLRGRFEVSIRGDSSVDPAYAGELAAAAAKLPVRFDGAFEREALADVYGAVDVLVVPSIWPENAPLVIQEARHYRVPVVASRIGGLPEFVRDGVDGRLFDPGSIAELQQILQELIEDPGQLARLSAADTEVKSIETDAAEWDRRYAELGDLRRDTNPEWSDDASGAARRDRPAEQAS
jgi:glycosyltransferase involved in cell wall biosynthesis